MSRQYDRSLRLHLFLETSFWIISLLFGLLCMIGAYLALYGEKLVYLPILQNLTYLYIVSVIAYVGGRQRRRQMMRQEEKEFSTRWTELIVVVWWIIALGVAIDVVFRLHEHNDVLWEVVKIVGFITGIFMSSEALKILLDRLMGNGRPSRRSSI